jgi:hypothetical protein
MKTRSEMYVIYDCRCSWCNKRRDCLNFFKSAVGNVAYWQESLCESCLRKALTILSVNCKGGGGFG